MSQHFQSSHFAPSHYLSSHFGRTAIVLPADPEQVHPMGIGRQEAALRQRILREDEEIFALIVAFMETKD